MKTASSIRYGGMLINAYECNYNSFKHLGLLCPICKRTVFLVGEADRAACERKNKDGSVSQVKSSHVSAYFAHHPEVDKNIVNDCELKSTQITSTEKLHLETKSRNQRAKIMQSHFWKILKTAHELTDPIVSDIPEIVKQCWIDNCIYSERKSLFALQEFINFFIKQARSVNDEDKKTEIERVVDNIIKSRGNSIYKEDLAAKEYIDNWFNVLDARMQSAIASEALEFLLQKKQIKILENMAYLALDAQIWHECRLASIRTKKDLQEISMVFYPNYIKRLIGSDYDDFIVTTLEGMFTKIIGMIVSVQWAYQFEILEQKELERRC